MNRLLGSEEVQERLGISRPTLYLWVRQGKLKPRKTGRALRFEEGEVERLLGNAPRVQAWVRGGRLEESRRDVAREARSGARPTFLMEYLGAPAADYVRGRVVPGGPSLETLVEAMARREHVFLSHEESVWGLHDVRAETSPGGDSQIVVELTRRGGPGEGDDRNRRLEDFVRTMRKGLVGRVERWTRDDLHERGPD